MDKNVLRQRREFDNIKVHLEDSRYRKMYELLKRLNPRRMLEIGCSSGEFLEVFKKRGWEVRGLEISEKAAKRALEREITVRVHDANTNLPFQDNSFDVVIAGEVIEHLFEDLDFLHECHRVLDKNGILLLTTPNLMSLKNRILMLFGFDPRYAIEDHHYKVYTPARIKRLFEKSKFSETKIRGNFIIYSKGRDRILGTIFEKLADYMPSLSEHFFVISRKIN